jgi:hypothetical protein
VELPLSCLPSRSNLHRISAKHRTITLLPPETTAIATGQLDAPPSRIEEQSFTTRMSHMPQINDLIDLILFNTESAKISLSSFPHELAIPHGRTVRFVWICAP